MIVRSAQHPGHFHAPDWTAYAQVAADWGMAPDEVVAKPTYWIARHLTLKRAEAFLNSQEARQDATAAREA